MILDEFGRKSYKIVHQEPLRPGHPRDVFETNLHPTSSRSPFGDAFGRSRGFYPQFCRVFSLLHSAGGRELQLSPARTELHELFRNTQSHTDHGDFEQNRNWLLNGVAIEPVLKNKAPLKARGAISLAIGEATWLRQAHRPA